MTLIRTNKRENPFAQIDKRILSDTRLTWKAKGILCYLLSKPNNWQASVKDIIAQAKEGRDAVYGAFKELMDFGYMIRVENRQGGKFSKYTYEVYETPINEVVGGGECFAANADAEMVVDRDNSTAYGLSVHGKTVNGKTVYGKSDTNNNDSNNTEGKDKEEDNVKSKFDYAALISFLNEVTGRNYRDVATTRTKINGRVREGFAMDDFKKVITHKNEQWGKDQKMRQYLRPETLFGTKFATYLAEADDKKTEGGYEEPTFVM